MAGATNPILSPDELAVVDALAKAWTLFVSLPVEHQDDPHDFRHAIHEAQRIVMARPALRLTRSGR